MSSGDLYERLENTNWRKEMSPIDFAYHVTDRSYPRYKHHPNMNVLKCDVAMDSRYDRELIGLPCVFFTTSTFGGELPAQSPYPVNGTPGNTYWRVKVPIQQFRNHDIWYCKHPVRSVSKHDPSVFVYQVRLILTEGRHQRALMKGIDGIIRLDPTNNPFLCMNKRGQWLSNEYFRSSDPKRQYVTNFVIVKDFDLEDVEWDLVERMKVGQGQPMSSDHRASFLFRQWSDARKRWRDHGRNIFDVLSEEES